MKRNKLKVYVGFPKYCYIKLKLSLIIYNFYFFSIKLSLCRNNWFNQKPEFYIIVLLCYY